MSHCRALAIMTIYKYIFKYLLLTMSIESGGARASQAKLGLAWFSWAHCDLVGLEAEGLREFFLGGGVENHFL